MQQSQQSIEDRCPLCGGQARHAYTGMDRLHGIGDLFHYGSCIECSAVFQYPVPDIDQIQAFYPQDYKPHTPPTARPLNVLHRAVLASTYGYTHLENQLPLWMGNVAAPLLYRKSIPFVKGGALLDVGCGGGRFLARMHQLGWRTQGVEFNASAVACCLQAGLEVFHGDLREADFAAGSFDAVTANHVIEHIAEPISFMAEIKRILKPGGMLYIRTPNSSALGRPWFGADWFANDIPRHLVLYNHDNLSRLAAGVGLEFEQTSTRSTPKVLLNSWDARHGTGGQPSRKRPLRRLPAKLYVIASTFGGRGDELLARFRKNAS